MNKEEFDLIDRYLVNELSDTEQLLLEQKLLEDPLFAAELENYKKAHYALIYKKRDQWKDSLKLHDKQLGLKQKTKNPFRGFKIIALLFSIGLVFWICWNFLNITNSKSDVLVPVTLDTKLDEKKTSNQQDSNTQTNQATSIVDSIYNANQKILIEKEQLIKQHQINSQQKIIEKKLIIEKQQTKQGKQINKEQPIADINIDYETLYADNYQPYRDDALVPETRAGSESGLDPYDLFINDYVEGQYEKALQSYSALSPVMQNDETSIFLKANCLMALNQMEAAKNLFNVILLKKKMNYLDDARWYLGLYNLKNNDILKTRDLFDQILSGNNTLLKNRVRSLLNKMK